MRSSLSKRQKRKLRIQNPEISEIDQLTFNIESSFCEPEGVDMEIETECTTATIEEETKEKNIGHIFLLQKVIYDDQENKVNSEETVKKEGTIQ